MPPDGELSDAIISIRSSSACSTSTSVIVPQKDERDPRKMARAYQLELCAKAMEENIIVYLGTGCGKTHIAVLLIYGLGHLIREPQRSVCIFLAPTVALVHQQAKVIEESTDFKVAIHCGSPKHLKSLSGWEKEIEEHEVLVMTPQVLLHGLSHSIIKMEFITLLIFDECHHAQVQSNHPYAQIMKVFYKPNNGKNPRIFGMTASPVVGKGASSQENLPKSINSLENILDAKVYSVDDEQLERFVAAPLVKVYLYGPVANSTSGSLMFYYNELERVKRQCLSEIGMKAGDHKNLQTLRHTKKSLIRMHENIMFCLKSLGVWGALQVCRILLGGDHCERNAVIEAVGDIIDEVVHGRYLNQVSSIFTNNCTRDGIISDISREEVLKEPFFSEKLLRLIGILSTFSLQPHMKCIVFVNRIATARSLAYILQNLKVLTSWKSDFLVGVHSGLKMSRKIMNGILEKFRDGKLNLLVATKVGEEGLDIQTCCLVIRFDLPETVSSFIQSRGRARMPQSEYVFLVDSGNQTEVDLIENFKKDEFRMHMEIFSRTSKETFTSKDEPVYKVEASGASISSGYSISLLHHYCAKLPHDEFFDPKPMFNYLDDLGGTVCLVNLPCNAPIHQVASTPQSSVEAAKKDACLKAIEQLHKLGALNDFLLPGLDADLESEVTVSDSNSSDESSRGELHEMMIPTALKESWSLSENLVYLHSYIVKFFPVPEDRIYKKFALFVKVPLPQEAERLELDLHLARGRSVFTKLVPSGVSAFTKEEIMEAMNFQEMFLKVILDRSKFVQEFVLLGNNGVYESCPTFYLLLPILDGHENRVVADQETVKRCLSSPIFQNPVDVINTKYFSSDPQLQMANGCQSICDIENSLVYARYRNTFYFVTNTIPEKNGHSPHKGSSGPSHMEHLIRTFDIQLKCPEQPLLRAKPLFFLHNLLHSRRQEDTESQDMDEFFVDLVPELCELKIKGFSKDIGSSISLLPSVMHRLENLLVALELKALLSASFSEAAEVSAFRILEALTTERCQERFSLERLEILGDAFLKFAVSRHLFLLHDTLDEGGLTRRRSNIVNNSNLFKLAIRSNLQVYIRDQPLDPCQFFALGYPCPRICTKDSEVDIHHQCESHMSGKVVGSVSELRCSKGHHWLHNKTVADVVEALVGAFVVDSGFKAAIAFLRWVGIKVDFETSQVINACQASAVYMPLSSSMDIANFEESFGYKFLYKGLLLQAFMHPSFNNGGGCYQRLEFLGDAALDYLITSYLFSVYPKLKPGLLTDLRSASVNNRVFATVSIEHSFDKFLMCDGSSGLSEAIQKFINFFKTAKSERGLLDEPKCPKVLSDLVESCMGAISLDTGFNLKRMWNVMISLLDPRTSFSNFQANPVKEMNEICQSRNWENPILVEKKGKTFFVEQRVVGKDVFISAAATNTNKKEAIRVTSEKIYLKLKDQGHIPKTNYLEEFLRTNQMMEAKLIGYDETPVEVAVPDAIRLKSLKIEEPFFGQRDSKIHSIKKVSDGFQPSLAVTEQAPSQLDSSGRQPGGSCHVSARSRLYEICTANCWKSPLFECCCEEGPSHLKCFTFKVSVEIEEAPDMLLECVGAPQATKKAAAEEAAKGAIWYLESRGYLH